MDPLSRVKSRAPVQTPRLGHKPVVILPVSLLHVDKGELLSIWLYGANKFCLLQLVLLDSTLCLQTDVYSIYTGDYETVIYTANSDQTSLVENFLPPQFIVTHMRIYPLTWHVYPSMRVEVKACAPDGELSHETHRRIKMA